MSPRRARLLIICVWILSFIICFPPLIGWNEHGGLDFSDDVTHNNLTRPSVDDVMQTGPVVQLFDDRQHDDTRYDVSDVGGDYVTSQQPGVVTPQLSHVVVTRDQCGLTSVPGYIVYSACGSFWVPMLGMIVFYWKIYKTAVAATDAVNRGFVEQKTSGLLSTSANDKTSCRLRVHRGGGAPATAAAASAPRNRSVTSTSSGGKLRHSAGCITELQPHPSTDDLHKPPARRSVDGRLQSPVASSNPSIATPRTATTTAPTSVAASQQIDVMSYSVPTIVITSSSSSHDHRTEHAVNRSTDTSDVTTTSKRRGGDGKGKSSSSSSSSSSISHALKSVGTQRKSCDEMSTQQSRNRLLDLRNRVSPPSTTRTSTSSVTSAAEKRTSLIASRFAKLHIISQLRSLNKEKKAAKTVGIIVGCFVVCWAPFFTVYLAGAFCPNCTPAVLFNIFFWLGYCNSAANPFIYGFCSKDFRYAFQKFLRCRYRRTKPALRHSANSQMMTMLQSLTMQVVAGGTINAAANVTAGTSRGSRRRRN